MERGQTPEILRLAPNPVFVSFTPLLQLCSLSSFLSPFLFLSFPFFTALKLYGCPEHSGCTMRAHYTWGLPIRKLNITTFNGFLPITYAFFFPYVPFLHHYMHRYDLSFGHAGLPSSCIYALCSR